MRRRYLATLASGILSVLSAAQAAGSDLASTVEFRIGAQPLASALLEFAAQSDIQIMTLGADVREIRTSGIAGRMTVREALQKLLEGSGLSFKLMGDGTVGLVRTSGSTGSTALPGGLSQTSAIRLAQGDPADSVAPSVAKKEEIEEIVVAIPEVLVVGSKILNMDIRRTEDDPQPYVVFEREVIQRSGAVDLQSFFKERLTMNTVGLQASQGATSFGNLSEVNLRGLGANQTLILIDGHRTAGVSTEGIPRQSDINRIPLAAIERIEVLPTTASGIYGGGATGGVINIVLRRDYEGAEFQVTYDNTFETDAATRRIDLGAGTTFEGGRTSILLAGSYSDADPLLVQDRDFLSRARSDYLTNNPATLFPPNVPPLGATPNIRSVNGSPLFGPGTPSFTSVPVGYTGGGGLAPLQANAGLYNLDPANSAQAAGGGRQALSNNPTVESLMLSARREFSPWLSVFLEASGSRNQGEFFSSRFPVTAFTISASAPNNPFGQAIQVVVPEAGADSTWNSTTRERRLLGGAIFSLPRKWMAEADYTWDRSTTEFSSPGDASRIAAAIPNGTVDVLRDTNAFPLDLSPYLLEDIPYSTPNRATLTDATLRFAGPIGSLAGGPVSLATLVEHREERLGEGYTYATPTITTYRPHRSQTIDSAYLEARIPLVGHPNRRTALQELELQLAVRWDNYATNTGGTVTFAAGSSIPPIARADNEFSSVNPTVALRYTPIRDVTLRGSYGTGFLPPAVNQLVPVTFPNVASGVDPRRGNTTAGPYTQIQTGNPDLEPEESESWSGGVIFTPRFASGLRLSVDYTRIDKSDNIVALPTQTVIDNEALLSGRVVRGPNLPGDLPGWAGPITSLDISPVNIANAKVEAYDVQLDYQMDSGAFGSFDFFALATWQTHYETQLLPGAATVENVGVSFAFPLRFKANAGLNWRYRDWTLGWAAHYFDSYLASTNATIAANQGNGGRVPSQMYHDVSASYRFASNWSPLDNVEIRLGARNVLNEEPPFDAGNTAFYYSPFGDPRLASYYVSLKAAF